MSPQVEYVINKADRGHRFQVALTLTRSKLICVGFAGVNDGSFRETRVNHYLGLDDKNTTKLIGRLHIDMVYSPNIQAHSPNPLGRILSKGRVSRIAAEK